MYKMYNRLKHYYIVVVNIHYSSMTLEGKMYNHIKQQHHCDHLWESVILNMMWMVVLKEKMPLLHIVFYLLHTGDCEIKWIFEFS